MAQIDRAYVALALILLIVGELLGFYIGAAADNRYLGLHLALVLPGFVTLAIFGFIFRLWPAMKEGWLAAIQFWLAIIGTIGMMIGTYQFTVSRSIVIIAPASAIAIVAAIILAWLFWSRSAPARLG